MENGDLIRLLKEVPEAHLRLFDITRKVLGEDGQIDPEKVTFHYKEIKEAVDEANAYADATRGAVRCLKMMDRSPQ
jgi:hypothetical protein